MPKPDYVIFVQAIEDIVRGSSYSAALKRHKIRPMDFCQAVSPAGLEKLLAEKIPEQYKLLIVGIHPNSKEWEALFRVTEEELASEYERIMHSKEKGIPSKFIDGLFNNQENIENLAYIALTKTHPELGSIDKEAAAKALEGLKTPQLRAYLNELGLGGAMTALRKTGITDNTPLALLEAFDRARQRKLNQPSLFKLDEEYHVPKWVFATRSYFTVPENRRVMVFYYFIKANPDFGSADRQKAVRVLENLPENLTDYFVSIGIPISVAERPHDVLKDIDLKYQEMAGKKISLFSLDQEYHAHIWGDKFKASQGYWRQNIQHAEDALYHMLIEHHPGLPRLRNPTREQVVERIEIFKRRLMTHICDDLGLSGLISNAFENLLEAVEGIDNAYRRRRKNEPTLFDLTQHAHLHRWDYSDEYMRDPQNAPEIVYHKINEDLGIDPTFRNRTVWILNAHTPQRRSDYFRYTLGLDGLNIRGDIVGQVRKLYDQMFTAQTRHPSILDPSHPPIWKSKLKKL